MRKEKNWWTSKRVWLLVFVASVIGGALAWMIAATWWGWSLVGMSVALVGAVAALSRPRSRMIQAVAGIAAFSVVVLAALAGGPILTTRSLEGPLTEAVTTTEGDVMGVRIEPAGVEAFAGVPYAAAPVGELRWEPPQAAPARNEVLVADDFGPSSFQSEPSFLTRAATRLIHIPLPQTFVGGYASDEDSLRLNIWRPIGASADTPRPVLVYIHGGAFTSGSGALPLYDGTSLASQGDIVVVTINYRLGVFGFLADDALGGSTAGNQGILDQLAALRWVQDNIRAFGGDPDHVTVAGESAGSGSACIMGASPLAAGLVHGIIGESGGCLGSVGNRETGDLYDDASTAREVAQELSRALGGATLDEMRKMPAERVAEAASDLTVHWFPTIDGLILPDTPTAIYDAGRQNDVPLLLGSNSDESSLNLVAGVDSDPARYRQEAQEAYGSDAERFLQLYPGDDEESVTASRIASETHKGMTAPMRKWALTATETGTSNVYSYSFSRTPPVPGLERFGAYHGAEVAYAYGNLGADGTPESDDVDRRLEAEMSAYWIAFVSSGDPNGAGRIHWPVLGEDPESLLVFGDTTAIAPRPFAEEVDFWLDR